MILSYDDTLQQILDGIGEEWSQEVSEYPGSKIYICYDPLTKGFTIGLYQEQGAMVRFDGYGEINLEEGEK